MIVTYDPSLVALSVFIAVCGCYTCFHLMDRLTKLYATAWKGTLVTASIAIGGGIWAMHFVGMLALHVPVTIGYDIQQTVLSALIAIGVTAVALYLVTLRKVMPKIIVLSGVLMGLGISSMHYVGMGAIRGNCVVSYSPTMVGISVLVGILASIMALYLASRIRNKMKQVPAAIAMGFGVAAMHYTGMYAASFAQTGEVILFAAPILSDATMAIVITVVVFLLLGSTFFLAAPVPDAPPRHDDATVDAPVGTPTEPAGLQTDTAVVRIPVQLGTRRTLLDAAEIICIQADSHYTKICARDEEFFCNLAISEVEKVLEPLSFLRVHRSHMVNVEHIKGFSQQKGHSELTVEFNGKMHQITVSRSKIDAVKASLKA